MDALLTRLIKILGACALFIHVVEKFFGSLANLTR